jgi:SAM-dependent methyltransferase
VDLQASYDAVAEEYAREFNDELTHKPFDRRMLDWLIEKVGSEGYQNSIIALGCGPGHVAGYLHSRGVKDVYGVDISPEMIQCARQFHPKLQFHWGDMLSLRHKGSGLYGGIAAFYSILHIPRERVVDALREMLRVLRPGGVLLLAFHIGDEVLHRDEWWGKAVSIDFFFYRTAEMKEWLAAAGFELEEAIERDPYPDVEYPSRRAYIFARRPPLILTPRVSPMTRSEFIRMLVVNEIADDYEEIVHVTENVSRDGAKCGLTITRADVERAFLEAVEMGLAKAYRLTVSPLEEIQGVPTVDQIEELYFYCTIAGFDFILYVRDEDWPFDDEHELRKDWTPPEGWPDH